MCSVEEIALRERLYIAFQNNAGFHLNKVFGPLLSKIGSAYSVMKVYGSKGFEVLKGYTIGGEAYIYNLRIEGRRAAGMVAWLAKLIKSGYVRVEDGDVYADLGGERLAVPLESLLSAPYASNILHSLTMLVALRRLGGACSKLKDGFVCSFKGLKFFVRKLAEVDLPLPEDFSEGPLLGVLRERFELEFFTKVLMNLNRPLVVDVGAYVGAYTIKACTAGASVVALEPDPDNFSVLKFNLELNECTNAKALQVAGGAKEGVVPLYQGVSYTTMSVQPNFEYSASSVKAYVKVSTIDNTLSSEGWIPESYIDYLKIDVEGAEVDVLRGAAETLQRTRYIQVEVRKDNIREVSSMLKKYGFKKLIAVEYGDYKNIIFRKV